MKDTVTGTIFEEIRIPPLIVRTRQKLRPAIADTGDYFDPRLERLEK